MPQKVFSPEEEAAICRMYTEPTAQGRFQGAGAIALQVGSNPRTIHNILNRHGVTKRSKTFYETDQPHPRLKRVPPAGEQPPLCRCGCGQQVSWLRGKNRWARYVAGHYTQHGKQNHDWAGGPVEAICEVCGKSYERDQHAVNSRFCSPACMGVAKRSPHYEGRERWYGWYSVRRRIRERDNWTCQDCGYEGKRSKRRLHVHHNNGNPMDNAEANLVLLCQRCHLARHGIGAPSDWPE